MGADGPARRSRRPDVLLVTCAALPDGGPEAGLVDLFARRGIDAEFAVWDDPVVDWSAADLIAIRTTWDYAAKVDSFVSWTRVAGRQCRMVNAPEVLAWNTDKRYLQELAEWGLPVVPTVAVRNGAELDVALLSYDVAVIKPVVGVSGNGLTVWRAGHPAPPVDRPMVVQPLVETVRTLGEASVFVMAGQPVGQVRKLPAGEEIRVQPAYGGRYEVEELDADVGGLAASAVGKVAARFGVELVYARVDLLSHAGSWVIGEVEVIEPSLYMDVEPAIAEAYVDAIAATLG